MDQSHTLPHTALIGLKLLAAVTVAAALLLSFLALLGAGPSRVDAAPVAQGTTFDCGTVSQIPLKECQALVSLYDDTGGAYWFTRTGWLQNTAVCSWYGITCDEGHVTELVLWVNNLSGTIPSSLGNLTSLRNLYLSSNRLTGTVPSQLADLSALTRLKLDYNQLLTGTLPHQLASLSEVTHFWFEGTNLCAPTYKDFRDWLGLIGDLKPTGRDCGSVTVTNEDGVPVPDALVYLYRDDRQIAEGTSDASGRIVFNPWQVGDEVAAIALQHQQLSAKDHHDGGSYKVYLTSMDVAPTGDVSTTHVTQRDQPLTPVIRATNPLILFNLLVSVEANVEPNALEDLSWTLSQASDFLYDVTDGQFALANVAIYDAASQYRDADMRVPAFQQGVPNALVGGIVTAPFTYTSSTTNTIVYAPGFFRMTPDWPTRAESPTCRSYCRTLVHELAHYALFLYDEYYRTAPDGSRELAHCTAPDLDPSAESTNASIMDNQVLTTSELAMNVEELGPQWTQWSTDCEQTEQWLLHGESDWETVTNVYSDTSNTEPRWMFKTPKTIQQANSGPVSFPLPDFTRVFTVNAPLANPLPPTVTVRFSDGTLCGGECQVYLIKRTGEHPNVILGMGSPREGRIKVPGLQIGSELIGITTDGEYFGSHTAAEPGSQTLTLDRSGWNPKVAAQLESHGTVMTVTVTITTTEEMSGLQALRMDVGAIYSETITLTGGSGVYTGTFVFDRRSSAQEGYIWIRGTVAANHQTVETMTSYALVGVPGSHEWGYLDLNSLEGTLNLLVQPGGIPADASVIVLPIRHLDPFLGQDQATTRGSAGVAGLGSRSRQASPLTLVGTGYYLGATEGVTGAITATLTLFYDPLDPTVRAGIERATFSIYHYYYNTATSQWEWKNLGGVIDRDNHSVSALINQLGTYALVWAYYSHLPVVMASHEDPDVPAIYLPMIVKSAAARPAVSR